MFLFENQLGIICSDHIEVKVLFLSITIKLPIENAAYPSRIFFIPFKRNFKSKVVGNVLPLPSILPKNK